MLYKKLLLFSVTLFLASNNCNASLTEYLASGAVSAVTAGCITKALTYAPKTVSDHITKVSGAAIIGAGALAGAALQYFSPSETKGAQAAALNPVIKSYKGLCVGTTVSKEALIAFVTSKHFKNGLALTGAGVSTAFTLAYTQHKLGN